MQNVNAELMPYVRMTYPDDKKEIGSNNVPLNTTLFKSVLLLFGFIPVDLHFLRLDKIDHGSAFYENSISLIQKYWKHTRILTAIGDKTLVRDELHFLPRLKILGYLLLPFIRLIFTNRHKQLNKFFI